MGTTFSTAGPSTRTVHSSRRSTHLTGRGRLLVLAGLVALMLAAFAAGRSASSQAVEQPEGSPALTQIVVEPGDTLWAVARRVAPERDPRELVSQIRRLNDLPTAALKVGQQLLLPAAA